MDSITITKEALALQQLRDRATRIKNLDSRNMYVDLLTYLDTCCRVYGGVDYLIKLRDELNNMNYVCSILNSTIDTKLKQN